MARRRCFVVDANIANKAAERGSVDRLKAQALLNAISQHRSAILVLPADLRGEWDDHMSPNAVSFLAQMIDTRRVVTTTASLSGSVITRLNRLRRFDFDGAALQHDRKLVEAAKANAGVIFSYDEKARCFFSRAARKEAAIRGTAWQSPLQVDASVWIRRGALVVNAMKLENHYCRCPHSKDCTRGRN